MKAAKAFFVSACLFLSILLIFAQAAEGQTTVSVTPATQTASFYSTAQIPVDVSIASVSGLYGYQLDVSYDFSKLQLIASSAVTEGAFLNQGIGGNTLFIDPNMQTAGSIRNAACTRKAPNAAVTGSGSLVRIKFTPKAVGTSTVTPSNVKLSDVDSHPISFTLSPNSGVGTIVVSECFSGETRECDCQCVVGKVTHSTRTCTAGNTWGTCACGKCGDLNNDNCVNVLDLTIVATDFGKTSGFNNPKSDITGDGVVDIFDLVVIGKNFNTAC